MKRRVKIIGFERECVWGGGYGIFDEVRVGNIVGGG